MILTIEEYEAIVQQIYDTVDNYDPKPLLNLLNVASAYHEIINKLFSAGVHRPLNDVRNVRYEDIITFYEFNKHQLTRYSFIILTQFVTVFLRNDIMNKYYFLGNYHSYTEDFKYICDSTIDMKFDTCEIENYIFEHYDTIFNDVHHNYKEFTRLCKYNQMFRDYFMQFSYIDHMIDITKKCRAFAKKKLSIVITIISNIAESLKRA